MINTAFMRLSIEEKKTKLKCALRSKTGDCLMDSELDELIRAISVKRQYVVHIHSRIDLFRDLLTLSEADHGHVALGQVRLGTQGHHGKLYCTDRPAAVVLHRAEGPINCRELHIYVPRNRKHRRWIA